MKSEWKKVSVSDLGRIVTGKTPKTAISEYYGGCIPFLTPSDDMSVKYVLSTSKTITESGKNSVKNAVIPKNSICVSCIGSDLGKVVITTKETVTNQQINSVIVNTELYDVDFVYYAMVVLGKVLNYHSKTSTAVPIVNKSTFSQYEILCPELSEQRKIARILSEIDSKIAMNTAINENLEQQAQALFKAWFVDFEPFGGVMPDDWQKSTLGDVSEMGAGGDKPQNATPTATHDNTVPIYSNGITDEGLYGFTNKAKIQDESVTVSARGTIGYVCLRQVPYVPIVRLVTLIPNKRIVSAKFLYHWLKTLHIAGTGTTQQQLTVPSFKKTEIIVPEYSIMEKFTVTINPLYEHILANKNQNQHLAALRDTLLPKLMNGEIDVSKV